MDKRKISVIIPTKDRESLLQITLKHLFGAINAIEAEIIVVNDSKKTTAAISTDYPVVLLNNPGNGVASARNWGARHASHDWLLFLDDDMLISESNISAYLAYTSETAKLSINLDWIYPPELILRMANRAFGRYLIANGFTTLRGWNKSENWKDNGAFETYGVTSQNLFLRKDYFLEVGGYQDEMPYAGFEDHILSIKLRKSGFTCLIDTTSSMFHNEADRVLERAWFKRKERGGATRKAAVNLGYTELRLSLSPIKKLFYRLNFLFEPLIKFILFFSTQFKGLDKISFRCYNALLGISIYKGYSGTD